MIPQGTTNKIGPIVLDAVTILREIARTMAKLVKYLTAEYFSITVEGYRVTVQREETEDDAP